MSTTEQQGPFFVERKGQNVVVRSHQPFSAILTFPMQVTQQGAIYVLHPPIALSKGMRILLSTTGYSDVVVKPEGES